MNTETHIKDSITTLNLVNYQIAELLRIKEELEGRLSDLFDHPEDCSKTYTFEKHKVTLTSKYIYSLNKDEYEAIGSRLSDEFNPVKTKTIYELDKKTIKKAENYASAEDLHTLSSIINKKPAKLHVKITAGV